MTREPFNPDLIRPPQQKRATATATPLSVSQLTAMVKGAIESALPPTVHVVGEISNFKRHSSGHLYFTLKDQSSEISSVMWRSAAGKLKFDPQDGLEVVATGAVEVFERAGRYQLYVRKLEPRGVGALELAFRQLCEKLAGEGLFDERHKRSLPKYPRRIALVTSPTGAALADILRTIARRYPCVQLMLYPVRVQGPGAAAEIAAAVKRINANSERLGRVDLLIVGRGGGSLEDLWAFNDEAVARAIHAGRIPTISAVGHEVDVTIADLVADVRAATPTAAAEIAVPVLDEVLDALDALCGRMTRAIMGNADLQGARLAGLLHRRVFAEPLATVHRREQAVDESNVRMQRAFVERVSFVRSRLDALERVVQRIAPHTYLLRTTLELRDAQHRIDWAVRRRMGELAVDLRGVVGRVAQSSPRHLVERRRDEVDRCAARFAAALQRRIAVLTERIRGEEDLLAALSYKSVIGRGFSITRTKKGRRVVRSLSQLHDHDRIVTELTDGEFEAGVVNLNQLELFD